MKNTEKQEIKVEQKRFTLKDTRSQIDQDISQNNTDSSLDERKEKQAKVKRILGVFFLFSMFILFFIGVILRFIMELLEIPTEIMEITSYLLSFGYMLSFMLTIAGCILISTADNTGDFSKAEVDNAIHQTNYAGFWIRFASYLIDFFASRLVIPLFFSLYFWFKDGQTLGNKAVRIRVYSLGNDGITLQPASVGQLFFYPIAKILNILTCFVGYLMIAFTKKKQGLHNMVTNTVVIHTK